jgi:hypothetical protein
VDALPLQPLLWARTNREEADTLAPFAGLDTVIPDPLEELEELVAEEVDPVVLPLPILKVVLTVGQAVPFTQDLKWIVWVPAGIVALVSMS